MAKIKDSVWVIFWESVKLYFYNFGSFFKYMAFPVFGQILGMILVLGASYLYTQNLNKMITEGGLFDNFSMIFVVLFIITLPGLLILTKAFWDYLVAYGAINSMVDNMLKSGKVYDFPAHTALITRRSGSFGALWVLLAILGLISIIPIFWVIAGILFIYCILVFQVFTFEPDKSPIRCFVKSAQIIKGNFARTLGLATLVGGISYWIIPNILQTIFDGLKITDFLAIPLDSYAQQFPINQINALLREAPGTPQITSLMIAQSIVGSLLSYIITCMLLPMRSICWALWYKNLNKAEAKIDKKLLDRATKSEA